MGLRRPVNEIRRVVTDYGPDPYGLAMFEAVAGEAMSRVVGYGGHVYLGDRGDIPSGQAWGGPLPSPQQFTNLSAPAAGNPVLYTDAAPMIDTAPSEGPTSDPVARILAQRLMSGG